MYLNIALAQIDIRFGQPEENLAAVRRLAAEAAAGRAELLVLPELWSSGYDLGRAAELADQPGEGIYAALSALARTYGIAIAGSTLARGAGRPTNRATLYGPSGALLATYDKTHLFGLMQEDEHLAPGNALALCEAPWGPTGLAICYDLRFPELFRTYALQGARVVIVPAEWPQPRLEHWRTLVRARAIEDQCFIVAVNRVGSDPANTFCGHSLVVDPWGEVLVEGDDRPALLFARLDLDQVEAVRSRMSVLRDRRPELYQ